MNLQNGYMAGANLGHWLSQYGGKGEEHFDTYITEPDFARMAEWGLDHVRLPVDYFFFETAPGEYSEKRLSYIDNVIRFCGKYGLNTVLDLHHAPGFFFGDGAKNDLFTNRASQERFIGIWKFFAERYRGEGDNLRFELLNELVWENSDPWNALWQEAAEAIHSISPERRIIVGGNFYNNVGQLKNLTVSRDERILYTIHFYEPFIFTHQRASWMEQTRSYVKPVSYPFNPEEHTGFFGGNIPAYFRGYSEINRAFLDDYLKPAVEFSEKTGKSLYCGEYGVIANASPDSAAHWLSDMADMLLSHGFGRAVWSYRGFSSITSQDNKTFDHNMAEAVARH